jgi:hypothetical protein
VTDSISSKLSAPLTIDQIDWRSFFDYRDGVLIWKKRPRSHFKTSRGMNVFNNRNAGKPAGSLHKPTGYVSVEVLGRKFKAHRIVWEMQTGKIPVSIDHINGDKQDNRIGNLRSASHSENMKNRPLPSNSKSGFMGVHWLKRNKKWCAYITSEGKRHHLGLFDDKSEAIAARSLAETQNGFHENHGRN